MPTPSEIVSLSTRTFDVEYLLQIVDYNDNILVTIGTPPGPGGTPDTFIIWEGEGEDIDGNETPVLCTVSNILGDVTAAWRGVVAEGYKRAVAMMLTALPTDSDVTKTSPFIVKPG